MYNFKNEVEMGLSNYIIKDMLIIDHVMCTE